MNGSGVCKNGCDNKYNDCPPRMADGRQFTDYRPMCDVVFGGVPQPMSSYDYRMFLTTHAEDIMNKNREVASLKSTCAWCDTNLAPGFKTDQSCDERVCGFVKAHGAGDREGIGLLNESTASDTGVPPWEGTAFAAA